MRSVLSASLFFVLFLLSSCEVEKSEPLFTIVGGQVVDTGLLKEKVLVINYWAEWCKPCVEEIPALNHFYAVHRDRVFLVGVNYDGLAEQPLMDQAAKMGIEFPLSQRDLADRLGYPGVEVLPTTVFLSLDNRQQVILKGPQTLQSLESALFSVRKMH
ncbi:MAG: TlpA family protein disulfide reductase [Pseudomonadales bacterium]|nr:TlpA family protein disulfide reductase [Pseudomonadales bacterium]